MSTVADTSAKSTTETLSTASASPDSSAFSFVAGLKRRVVTALPPIGVFAFIMILWYGIHSTLGDNKYFLPLPPDIIKKGFGDDLARQQIIDAFLQTSKVAFTGLAIAAGIGILWAVGMGTAKWIERSTYPYAVVLQCIPILAIVPLIGIWFGYEFKARVVVTVMIALFPMVANTLFGLQSVERSQLELFQLQKARRLTVLAKLMFPTALPAVFVGLRTSAGLSVVGAIVGDFFFQRGTPGLGAVIATDTRLLHTEELFATIFVAAGLGVAVFAAFGLLSKLIVGRWYEAAR